MKEVVRKRVAALPNLTEELELQDYPELSGADYFARVELARTKMDDFTHLMIYGDREHFSNIEFFTGLDPRFEEALFIIPREGVPTLIVGNEGEAYSGMIGYEVHKIVYSTFSLPGQPHRYGRSLEDTLKSAGLDEISKVGLIGWKVFTKDDRTHPGKTFDLPFFIMESLLKVVPLSSVYNAIELMIGLDAGLRITHGTKELLLSEIAGTLSSRNTLRVIQNLRAGMTEVEASDYLRINGMPLSVHPNINFGNNLTYGLASPLSGTRLKYGDVVGVGMAYRRTLVHKVGYFIDGPADEPNDRKEFYDRYFRLMATWYESLRIGVTGGELYEITRAESGGFDEFGIGLNPGHLIHTDEWTNTLFKPGCKSTVRSGMLVQCDFTAAKPHEKLIAHAEDGVLIANEDMRNEIKTVSPAAWNRIVARRKFMIYELGIMLSDDILPTSDLPGVIFPYMRDLATALAYR